MCHFNAFLGHQTAAIAITPASPGFSFVLSAKKNRLNWRLALIGVFGLISPRHERGAAMVWFNVLLSIAALGIAAVGGLALLTFVMNRR